MPDVITAEIEAENQLTLDIPDVTVESGRTFDVRLPDIRLDDVFLGDVEIDLGDFELPEVEVPEIDVDTDFRDVELPDLPEIDLPEITVPDIDVETEFFNIPVVNFSFVAVTDVDIDFEDRLGGEIGGDRLGDLFLEIPEIDVDEDDRLGDDVFLGERDIELPDIELPDIQGRTLARIPVPQVFVETNSVTIPDPSSLTVNADIDVNVLFDILEENIPVQILSNPQRAVVNILTTNLNVPTRFLTEPVNWIFTAIENELENRIELNPENQEFIQRQS